MKAQIQNLINHEFVGVKELAESAESILRANGLLAEKDTVPGFPNDRNIRYLLADGLLPPPAKKRGQALVFEYRHLLILLCVRQLKAQKLPHSVIKNVIELKGKSVKDLEKLWIEGVKVFTEVSALNEYRRASGHNDYSDITVISDASAQREYQQNAPKKDEAKKYLESLLLKPTPRKNADSSLLFSATSSSIGGAKESSKPKIWKRFEIAPGLELSIEQQFKLPTNSAERLRFIQVIEEILGT